MGKKSRTKGHSFEREIANRLKAVFPNAIRLLEYQEALCKGIDIQNTGNLRIQCKRFKRNVSTGLIHEIQATRAIGEVPILVSKADHGPILATLYLDDLLDIIDISKL